ncbi:TFIIH basal transcription factor complex helicase subunit [Coccidioides immitis RMSCC 3703]|uniref:TFIIH basal transcription factor complex helicase subunit n=1 Tax=Coccidioides immitis RMSCC 3703 TaxID=454286 RepID=A0A0J8QHK9_COCIT|nr:TFIIH basal transcription factor complex helicase subunit [Coccidioides immitis RMSCC 3703]
MAQPFKAKDQEADLERHLEKQKGEAEKKYQEANQRDAALPAANGANNNGDLEMYDDGIDEDLMMLDAE